jgi:hypothetical protein
MGEFLLTTTNLCIMMYVITGKALIEGVRKRKRWGRYPRQKLFDAMQ